jgi:putative ABC transport system permease protein
MNLLPLILQQWRQRPARTSFSLLSVSIAVAAILGTMLAQSSVRQGNRELSDMLESRPAFDIVAATGGRLALDDVPKLADVEGLRGSFPVISRAALARVHGHRLRTILVALPLDSPVVWQDLPITQGRACHRSDEVLLAAEIAKNLQAEVGDRLTLVTRRGPRPMTIVGLVSTQALNELAPAATLLIPLTTAQQFFGLEAQADRVRVLVSSHDERPSAEATVSARLPQSMVVQQPSDRIQLADTILRSTELALRFSGALSLAMAAFIILNTLRMNFGERRGDVALLRILGATQTQIASLHLIEGAILGLLGSIVGIGLGLMLGRGLAQVMQRLIGAQIAPPHLSLFAIVVSIALGPLIAAAAAVVPAIQSRKVSAQEALGNFEPRRGERFPLWAFAAGTLTIIAAMVLMQFVVTGRLPPAAAIPVGLMMLLAFIVVLPVVIVPVARGSAWLIGPWLGIEGQLAVDQLLQRAVRTGLTAGVLVVALNTGLGLGNAILNNVAEVRQWHRRWVSADVSLMDPSAADATVDAADRDQLRAKLASQDDVARVVEMRFLPARINGNPACCIVRDFPSGAELPWTVARGNESDAVARLRGGEIAVASLLAKKLDLHLGDTLRLELSGRMFSLRIAALVNDYTLGGLVAYLDRAAASGMVQPGPATLYMVQAKAGAPKEQFMESMKALGSDHALVVQPFSQLRDQLDGLINGVVGALWVLLLIGFVVGGMAVANTLTMNVLEQTRELGLLRIVGMTSRQVRKLVLCESLLLGIIGTLMGTLAGTVTAVIIHYCNEPLMGYSIPFNFSGLVLLANAAGCLLVAVLAAWSPAKRAAGLDLLAAIAYE